MEEETNNESSPIKIGLEAFKKHYKECINNYEVMGRGKLPGLYTDEKGSIINSGECGRFANYVLETLPENIDKRYINVWAWEGIHTFIVGFDKIWDAQHAYSGMGYSRDTVNKLFLCYASSLALGLNEHYYIESRNGQSIQYDPWEFVDNQCYDHDRFPVYPSRETVYTVKEFLEYWKAKKEKATKSLVDYINEEGKKARSKD